MLDPELSYAFVSMRKGKAICGMTVRKASRIEVEAETFFLGPCDPIMKMAGFNRDPLSYRHIRRSKHAD